MKRASGGIVSSLVFGGLDGITTTFAVLVASAAGIVLFHSFLFFYFLIRYLLLPSFFLILFSLSKIAKTVISSLLIITFANLIGDAVGMAVGDWLGSIAEDDMNDKKIKEG